MKRISAILVLSFLCSFALAAEQVTSPDGKVILTAGVEKGKAYYEVSFDGKAVMDRSFLGFRLHDGDFSKGFKVVGVTRDSFDETWEQPWGEQRLVRNNYNELTLSLKGRKGRLVNVVFRVFNDGVGFRYEFPEQASLKDFRIMEEYTQFALPCDAPCWAQPHDATFYEGLYTDEMVSQKDTIATPATLELADDLYVSIHEADLTDYASLALTPTGTVFNTALVPWANGVKVYASAPCRTPWRTIVVGDHPGDLLVSRLILNLNEPCRIEDTSWLETGRYIGIWWQMHLRTHTWNMGPRHAATTEITKQYIDFAAKHGFKGVLVEGWNKGWELRYDLPGNNFSFVEAYPDYDIEALCEYAASKGVKIIAHNETGGNAAHYEEHADEAFAYYRSLGINSVKTGYVNKLLDGKELQHSQYGIRHYRKILEKAAQNHIMVVNHEPAMPTGLRRTYPNMMSGEGVRGQEWNAWNAGGGNPPYHTCILPFTRGLAGPMDFTPVVFNYEKSFLPDTRPLSTRAKQLAEFVVLYTPWQMAADIIENLEGQPALTFVENCPTDWEQTVVPCADLGEYAVIARQERKGTDWFVGAVNNENPRQISLSLDFLEEGAVYDAFVYEDGPDAHYLENPYAMAFRQLKVTSADVLDLKLAASGGAAIRLERR